MKWTKEKIFDMIWQLFLAILPSTGLIWNSLKTMNQGTITMSIDIQFVTNIVLGFLLVWLYRQIRATTKKAETLDENIYMLNNVTVFRMVKNVKFISGNVHGKDVFVVDSDLGQLLPYLEYLALEKKLMKEFLFDKLGKKTTIEDVDNLLNRWYHELN